MLPYRIELSTSLFREWRHDPVQEVRAGTDLVVGNGVQTLAGGLALAPLAFTFESVSDIVPTVRFVGAMAYVILCSSVAAYLLWFRLVMVYGATAASAYHFLMPPLGMLFGWILLGEHVHAPDLLGVVPVAAGIWLVTRPSQSRR